MSISKATCLTSSTFLLFPLFSLLLHPPCMAGRTHTKITGAPDYDDPEFWDDRFATGRDVGEWLNSGNALVDAVLSDLDHRVQLRLKSPGEAPRVLHLGPGVSQLGPKLRDACLDRRWAGNGILVSRDNACVSLLPPLSPLPLPSPSLSADLNLPSNRMLTSPPRPCVSVKTPNERTPPPTRCTGGVPTSSCGIMSQP